MKGIKINKIEDVATTSFGSFDKALKAGLIVFYDSNSILNICSAKSFESKCSGIENGSSDYYIIGGNLCLKFRNEIRCIDLDSCSNVVLCKTDKSNIDLINQDYSRAGSSFRNPRRKINDIIRTRDSEVVYSWQDNRTLISWDFKHPVFYNYENQKLFSYDVLDDRVLWDIFLDKGFAGVRYIQDVDDKELLIQRYLQFEDYNLLKVDVNTGTIVWEIADTFNHYNYEEASCKLYGLGGKTFEVIDVNTGEREMQKELDADLHLSSHLTSYDNGYLYFSGYLNKRTPVFGAVNVKNGELVFTQEVEMSGYRSFKKGLDRPVVVGNRLYIRDSLKTLHIFEMVDNSLT